MNSERRAAVGFGGPVLLAALFLAPGLAAATPGREETPPAIRRSPSRRSPGVSAEAMALFRDGTGRPGPSTWELGSYRQGQADVPVGGVSWYEASAYAVFAGRTLPTFHHWFRAAGADDTFSGILPLSN